MASIKRRPDGQWRARYRDPDGSEHARHFERKLDAERWLDGIRGDLVRGNYVDPAAGRITFGEYAARWQTAQVHRPTTVALVDSHLRNHVLPAFGDRPLASVRRSDVQGWVKDRAEVLAPATVTVAYRYLATIFRSATDDRLIMVSPCSRIALPKAELRRVEPLSTESVLALVDAVPERYRAMVLLTAGAGLRQGEAFGLTVPHLDMLRRTLRVEQQLTLLPGRPPYLAPPKTEASRRTIPLPQVAVEALAAHLAAFPAAHDGLVFTGAAGAPIRRTRFSQSVWVPAVRRAGLPTGTHFHDLRHYYASLLIRHGESVKVVQARLGHASATETLDTYSHLWPDSEDRTRQAIDAVLAQAPADWVRTRPAG